MTSNHKRNMPLCFIALVFAAGCSVAKPPVPNDPVPRHETFQIQSKILDETRVICVWTPADYSTTQRSYPVLYMPDGGVHEDFPHIANTIAELVEQSEIAPVIVVGIENTERRRDLTGPSNIASDAKIAPVTDGASAFRAFIKNELFPAIEERYRVDNQRAIVGESAAGLFVVETLLLAPTMFDVYIAMDPALHWNDHYLVRHASSRLPSLSSKEVRFWFTAANTQDIQPHTEMLSAILAAEAPPTLIWQYSPRPKERHNTIFRATKVEAFQWALWSNTMNDTEDLAEVRPATPSEVH